MISQPASTGFAATRVPALAATPALPVVPFDLLNLEARKPVIYEGSPIFGDTRLLMFSFNPDIISVLLPTSLVTLKFRANFQSVKPHCIS